MIAGQFRRQSPEFMVPKFWCVDDENNQHQVKWESRVTTNAAGRTGMATFLVSQRYAGSVLKVHLCKHAVCAARWDGSKYGLLEHPLHVRMLPPDGVAVRPADAESAASAASAAGASVAAGIGAAAAVAVASPVAAGIEAAAAAAAANSVAVGASAPVPGQAHVLAVFVPEASAPAPMPELTEDSDSDAGADCPNILFGSESDTDSDCPTFRVVSTFRRRGRSYEDSVCEGSPPK